jgi:hypothetical protein
MMEDGIGFSPYSLKLTTMDQCYLRPANVLAREDAEVHLHAPPRLNISGYVYGRNVILKNCIIVRKKHLDHRMHLVT